MKDTERHNYIGDHIRKLREGKGWTQQMLGNKLGKKTSTISAYETNAKLPSVDCLIEMADLLGVSLDTLVYGENADLLSVHTLTQEQKKIVTAIVQAFEDTSLNAKTQTSDCVWLLRLFVCWLNRMNPIGLICTT